MVESTKRMRGHKDTDRQTRGRSWIRSFADYFLTQRYSMMKRQGARPQEAVVMPINPDAMPAEERALVDGTERIRGHAAAGRQTSDAQWIEAFAHSFVTQRHVMVKTRGVMVKEGTVTQINLHSVHVVGIHGADYQIPFRGIEDVTPVGEAAMPLGPMATQHIYEFAGFMARGEQLRIETADDIIEQAEVRQLIRTGITVADTFDGVGISVPFTDITHMVSVGRE